MKKILAIMILVVVIGALCPTILAQEKSPIEGLTCTEAQVKLNEHARRQNDKLIAWHESMLKAIINGGPFPEFPEFVEPPLDELEVLDLCVREDEAIVARAKQMEAELAAAREKSAAAREKTAELLNKLCAMRVMVGDLIDANCKKAGIEARPDPKVLRAFYSECQKDPKRSFCGRLQPLPPK